MTAKDHGYRKFTDAQLQELLDKGFPQTKIAALLGVGKSAVSRRVKRLKERSVEEVEEKMAEIETALEPLVSGDLSVIASDPGKSLHQVVIIYLGLLKKLVRKEVSASSTQWPLIAKQILAVGDSLAKHLVNAIQLTELLRYRQNVERIEKVLLEITDELPEEYRSRFIKKLQRGASAIEHGELPS